MVPRPLCWCRRAGIRFMQPTRYAWPGRLNPVLARPAASPAGPSSSHQSFSCEKDGLHQSRMFPTLAILNAPKSGTPDFGVKPGNDGGNRGTSVLHPFDRDLLLEDWPCGYATSSNRPCERNEMSPERAAT